MINLKGLNHFLHCTMDAAWIVFFIGLVHEYMAVIPYDIMYALWKRNNSLWCHLSIYHFIKVDLSHLYLHCKRTNLRRVWGPENIGLMAKALLWDPSSPAYSHLEQNSQWKLCCETCQALRKWIVSTNTPARGQLFMEFVTSYAGKSAILV